MVDINQKNFNNPQNLQLSNSYSTISATLNNPYVPKPIEYNDFRSSDPVLNKMLPAIINLGKDNGNANNGKDILGNNKNLNLGLTSPGFVDNAYKCSGLDFINTNPNYDKLPFKECLNKFNTQFQIPEMVFNNLMNNLPYTFSALTIEEKKRYLSSLNNFINTESLKNGINLDNLNNIHDDLSKLNKIRDNSNDSNDSNDSNGRNYNKTTKEHFGNKKENGCSSSDLSLSGILSIVLVIIIVIIFVIFITNKN